MLFFLLGEKTFKMVGDTKDFLGQPKYSFLIFAKKN
jgi:hypothetical protein